MTNPIAYAAAKAAYAAFRMLDEQARALSTDIEVASQLRAAARAAEECGERLWAAACAKP